MVLNLSNRLLQLCLQVNLERTAGGQSGGLPDVGWSVRGYQLALSLDLQSLPLVTLSQASCSGELCFHLSALGYVFSSFLRIDFLHFGLFFSPVFFFLLGFVFWHFNFGFIHVLFCRSWKCLFKSYALFSSDLFYKVMGRHNLGCFNMGRTFTMNNVVWNLHPVLPAADHSQLLSIGNSQSYHASVKIFM